MTDAVPTHAPAPTAPVTHDESQPEAVPGMEPGPAAPAVSVMEVRVLEGPNLYFTRPAVKVMLDVPGIIDAPARRARRLAGRLGLRSADPGRAGTLERQQFAVRVARQLVRRLTTETGIRNLRIAARAGNRPTEVIVAFPWARRARALLAGDLNMVADVLGAESGADTGPVVLSLLGPVSLAATVHVRNGEKLQSDPGARRDLTQSWCAGMTGLRAALRRNTDGRGTVLVLHEPELERVLAGRIPTASGYRTLRALPRHEVRTALTDAVRAARSAGVVAVALDVGPAHPRWARDVGADIAVLPAPDGPTAQWEPLAALHEAGVGLCLDSVPVSARTPLRAGVERIVRPWSELGMDPAALLGTGLAPSAEVSGLTPPELPAALARVTQLCGALTDVCNEA